MPAQMCMFVRAVTSDGSPYDSESGRPAPMNPTIQLGVLINGEN